MSKVIATIRLAPGRVGFFDPLSRIHLTLGRPEAQVLSGTNCASLRRNVKAGVIRLVDGTLGEDIPPFKVVEVNGKYKLASNAAAEMAPVYAKEDDAAQPMTKEEAKKKIADAVAEVKGAKVEDGGDVKEAVAEEVKPAEPIGAENGEAAADKSKEEKKAPAKKKAAAAKKKAAAEE